MKTISKVLILGFAVSLFAVTNSYGQYVKAIPTAPKNTVKPTRTSKFEVWVPEDWGFDGIKSYVFRPGYWAFPPTPKSVYIPGKWEKSAKGYIRVPGYWQNPH